MPNLRQLNAKFMRVEKQNVDPEAWIDGMRSPSGVRTFYIPCEFAEAHGMRFDCPCAKCQAPDSVWAEKVLIGFRDRGCPAGEMSIGSDGKDTRWKIEGGSGLDDLQLSPSIQMNGGCNWHGFVGTNGAKPGETRTV